MGWWERGAEVLAWVFQLIAQARHGRVALHQRAQAEESRCMRDLELIELRSMMTIILSLKMKVSPNILFMTGYCWAYQQTWNMLERKLTSCHWFNHLSSLTGPQQFTSNSSHIKTSLVFCALSHFALSFKDIPCLIWLNQCEENIIGRD